MMKCLLIIPMILMMTIIFQEPAPASECTKPIDCVSIAPNEPIRIGVLHDKSYKAVSFGTDQIRAIEIALDQRGRQLHGHPVELQVKDSRCSWAGGKVATEELVSDSQIVALFGPTCSQAAVIASKIMSKAGLVMIAGTNSASSLTSISGKQGADWQPGYFRTLINDHQSAQTAVTFTTQKLGITKVATINDGDKYTRGFTEVYEKMLKELGGRVVLNETVNKGDTNILPVLTAIANSKAELLFISLFVPEGKSIVSRVKEVAGLDNIILMGSVSLLTEDFIQAIGNDGKGMYFLNSPPFQKSASHHKFISDYQTRYHEFPLTRTYGYSYDAANLLLNAIERAVDEKEDGTLHIKRQALRDALYATRDFDGVSGKLTCDRFGDCGSVRYNIVRLDDPATGAKGAKSNIVYVPLN